MADFPVPTQHGLLTLVAASGAATMESIEGEEKADIPENPSALGLGRAKASVGRQETGRAVFWVCPAGRGLHILGMRRLTHQSCQDVL